MQRSWTRSSVKKTIVVKFATPQQLTTVSNAHSFSVHNAVSATKDIN